MGDNRRKHLSIEEKCKIIEFLENGSSIKSLSQKYGIASSTVCSIKNKKKEIIAQSKKTLELSKRHTLKKCGFPKMEKLLYEWINEQRSKGIQLNGVMIKSEAMKINARLKESKTEFLGSDGWLRNFKKRFGISLSKSKNEKLSCEKVQEEEEEEEEKSISICSENVFNIVDLLNISDSNVTVKRDEITEDHDDMPAYPFEEVEVNRINNVSDQKALESINVCIQWAEFNNIPLREHSILKSIRDMIINRINDKKMIQTKVTDYFPRK